MKYFIKYTPVLMVLIVLIIACTEPFDYESKNYEKVLVIEGSITDELKNHRVKLSYTQEVNGDQTVQYVTEAEVYVLKDSDEKIEYSVVGEVYESVSPFQGVPGEKFQLVVILDGERYESTLEELRTAPTIDSIYDKFVMLPSEETNQNEPGIQFFLDTHDDTGNAKFFRYEWNETYKIAVPFPSFYEVVNNELVSRTEPIGICFSSDQSNTLIVGSSTQSSTNTIAEFPIRHIEQRDTRIRTRYSIEVTQYAISEHAYLFYKKIIESSESSGSFFDKQLGTIVGNIKSIENPNKPVLGYFEVSGSSKLRAFFSANDFDEQFVAASFQYRCIYEDAIVISADSALVFLPLAEPNYYAFSILSPPNPSAPDSVIIFARPCTSCNWYADTTVPDFWIE